MARYSKKEIAQVEADRAFWQKYATFFDWHIIGWTYRNSAIFGRNNGKGSVSVGDYGHINTEELDKSMKYN